MTKQIQLSDERYEQLVRLAKANGYRIGPGRSGGIGQFIADLLDGAEPIAGDTADEVWARFNTRIMPAVGQLMLAVTRWHERADTDFKLGRGLIIKRIIE